MKSILNRFTNFYTDLLTSDSKISSMRWSVTTIVFMITICILIIHIALFKPILNNDLNGYEIAGIIASDTALLFSIIYGKFKQYSMEKKDKNKNEI